MKGLIDHAASQEHQIAMLWQAIETLTARQGGMRKGECVPADAHTTERFDSEELNRLVK